MQTFLPYPDFEKTAKVLDRARLGKQRVEVIQILNALTDPTKGWANHPATKMWKGREYQLTRYGLAMCKEWARRGYSNELSLPQLEAYLYLFRDNDYDQRMPWWMGMPKFHTRHRLMLVWKDEAHYLPLFDDISAKPRREPVYYWPKENPT